MDVKDFIISKLDALLEKFKNAKVRYENDSLAEIHCVEVTPKEVYNSIDFKEWEDSVVSEFDEQFPFEGLYFFSDDSAMGIRHEDYSKEGLEFNPCTANERQEFDIPSVLIYSCFTPVSEINVGAPSLDEESILFSYPTNYQFAA